MPKNQHPRVFVDVSIGTRTGGRIVFELFNDVTPRTAENFRGLCTGEYGTGRNTKKALNYTGCSFFRSIKGQYLQSGDFQFNNGDGGESIYGGTFNDEDFSRRHTQAGILSMANKGRNTNSSQFFITLKRTVMLDNRHVAFGQVVDGMDVVRAMAAVPTDKDDKPRVPIHIVGCGEMGKAPSKKVDATSQFAEQIAELHEEVAPTKVRESTKGQAILSGKAGGAPDAGVGIAAGRKAAAGGDDDDELESGSALAPPKNEREKRLMELRMRMNQCRVKNSKEVVEEQKRFADPQYAKRQAEQRHKQNMEKEEKAAEDDGKPANKGALPTGKEHLADTIEKCELKEAKKKRGNPDAFGWDVFNQDSLYRAHEKRLKTIEFDQEAYDRQKAQEEGATSLEGAGFGFKASEEQKDKLQQAMEKISDKKKQFSRRRMHVADEDVNYVNDQNRHFNKKMERFFGEYTHETRQNLERGTAL